MDDLVQRAGAAFVGSDRGWQAFVRSAYPTPGLQGLVNLCRTLERLAATAQCNRDYRQGAILFGCLLKLRWCSFSEEASTWPANFTECWCETWPPVCGLKLDIAMWLVEGSAVDPSRRTDVIEILDRFLVSAKQIERELLTASMKHWQLDVERLR